MSWDEPDVVDPKEQIRLLRDFSGPAPVGDVVRTVQGPPARREGLPPVVAKPAAAPATKVADVAFDVGGGDAAAVDDLVGTRTTPFGGRPTSNKDFGRRVGSQRSLGLYLPRTVREALEQRRREVGRSRGSVLVDSFRHAASALRAEYGLVDESGDARFAPFRSTRRVEDGSMVTFYVPEAQTQSIVALAEELGVSVSEAGTLALVYELLGAAALANHEF